MQEVFRRQWLSILFILDFGRPVVYKLQQYVAYMQTNKLTWGSSLTGIKALVKRESTAALVRKQQVRQQAALAHVYQRELALEKAVDEKGQENAEQAATLSHLQDKVASLTKLYQPIKGRAGKLPVFC